MWILNLCLLLGSWGGGEGEEAHHFIPVIKRTYFWTKPRSGPTPQPLMSRFNSTRLCAILWGNTVGGGDLAISCFNRLPILRPYNKYPRFLSFAVYSAHTRVSRNVATLGPIVIKVLEGRHNVLDAVVSRYLQCPAHVR